ncbi:MAG: deoxyhypusine synthase [Methermicoccaceae archaeon]
MDIQNTGEPISPVRAAPHMTVDEIITSYRQCAFGARKLAEAADILYEMTVSDATVFLGLAGAMVPAGMREVVCELMRSGCVDVLVSTGANMVHDAIEALGYHHYKGTDSVDDVHLRERNINRIYDVFLPEGGYEAFETFALELYENVYAKRDTISICELMDEAGAMLDDSNSILGCAHELGVPVYCPAVQDSSYGLQGWLFNQTNNLVLDAWADMRKIIDTCYDASSIGALFVGGGVPKNFILQTTLVTSKGFDYVVQLTMDRPEMGGLSGATLEEAQSWGKVNENARKATVYSDATITFPLLAASLLTRLDEDKSE